MLKTLAKYKFVIVLTGYILQISACKVHREPSCCRHTINIVGLLPLWEMIGYCGTVIHIYIWKADASSILGQPNIARDSCVGRASKSNKLISKTTGIWKKAWEPALGNNCWSLAWNNEMIVSVRHLGLRNALPQQVIESPNYQTANTHDPLRLPAIISVKSEIKLEFISIEVNKWSTLLATNNPYGPQATNRMNSKMPTASYFTRIGISHLKSENDCFHRLLYSSMVM